jgi:putative PIN family toxin of toxin-antitoxin system
MKVVVDTNVAVSGLLWEGPPNDILKWARDGVLVLVACQETVKELARILQYKKFQPRLSMIGMSADEVTAYYMNLVRFVPNPKELPKVIPEDPLDNLFLALASESKAQLIVSGDHHLLGLASHRGIQIVTPNEACKVIETLLTEKK